MNFKIFTSILSLNLSFFVLISPLYGQSNYVEGHVFSADDQQPLIGTTVLLEGTSNGAISDLEGYYRIEVSAHADPVLVFSSMGFRSHREMVSGRTTVDVYMQTDVTSLSEVVVTAFGVKNEVKGINYAVQKVDSKDLEESRQENLVNALTGKIAGVQVTNSSGSAGASSQILIRGITSVSENRDNQPLFVIDGLPIDNSASFGGGNRAMDINMADVASVSVLKGPAAAALYGIEAANGAIIITTKSGVIGKTKVGFSSSVSLNMAGKLPPRQEMYKQGSFGVYDPEVTSSWGPAFLSTDTKYDNIGDFLQTGVVQKYDLSVSGASEKSSMYVSGNYLDQTGIFPGEEYKRYGALLKGSTMVGQSLTVNGSANLIHTDNIRSGNGSMYNVYRWPLNHDMSTYLNPDGSKRWMIEREEGSEWNNPENPYWKAENNPITDDINRLISMVSINWDILNALTLTYRVGTDLTNQHYKSITSPGSAASAQSFAGRIAERERYYQKTNSTLLLSYNATFWNDFKLSALVGNNIQMESARTTYITGNTYLNPDLHNINNMVDVTVTQSLTRKRMLGVYADLKLDYKGVFYLEATVRQDWSSTLTKDQNSFFYPSISGGLVVTELLPSGNIISFGKLRGSWAEVGKDAPPHNLTSVLEPVQTIGGGFKYDYYAGNPGIRPETTRSWEIGTDLRLFNGRTRMDATYYSLKTIDQIITTRISPSSGWIMLTFNSGSIENKGFELFIENRLLQTDRFSWDATLNLSSNNSTLVSLPSFVSEFPVTSGQLISAVEPKAVVGSPALGLAGSSYLRNENGELVIGENGYPRTGKYVLNEDGSYRLNSDGTRYIDNQNVFLGNREPDYLIGLTNTFSCKGFSLSFLFDIRVGGDVLNATKAVMIVNGTTGYLDEYRNKVTVFDGVIEQGNGTFVKNTREVVLDQSYFVSRFSGVGENFVEDATWTRLRYVTFSYDVPAAFSEKLGMRRVSVAATARNLALWTKYSGGDPETNYAGAGIGGGGTAGLDYFGVPAVRGFDFSLRASF